MKGPVDEKEVLVRHAYGVGYPEPNVTFALCRGTWSSPAVSVLLSKLTLINYHIRIYLYHLKMNNLISMRCWCKQILHVHPIMFCHIT